MPFESNLYDTFVCEMRKRNESIDNESYIKWLETKVEKFTSYNSRMVSASGKPLCANFGESI